MEPFGTHKAAMRASVMGVQLMNSGLTASGGQDYTPADLADAVAATACPAVGAPVIAVGQQPSRHDGQPAFGRVNGLRVTDGVLTGDLVDMPGWLAERIAGAQRGVSGSRNYRCSIGHLHPLVVFSVQVFVPDVAPISNLDDIRRLVAASKGDTTVDNDGDRILAAHQIIMDAARRGAISPGRAIQAAADAAAGEDQSYLGTLTGVAQFSAAAQAVPNLSSMVLDVLAGQVTAHSHQQALTNAHQALDVGHAALYPDDPAEADLRKTFPPSKPLGPPASDDERAGHVALPSRSTTWDGYVKGSAGDPLSDDELYDALYSPNGTPRLYQVARPIHPGKAEQ